MQRAKYRTLDTPAASGDNDPFKCPLEQYSPTPGEHDTYSPSCTTSGDIAENTMTN